MFILSKTHKGYCNVKAERETTTMQNSTNKTNPAAQDGF